jgi:hypothetical protein
MTFLNWSILFAAGAVALPILIHLLNRRSAKIVPWGAMHFLLGSLVSRKRRILLDEMLLLACRCLLVALLVTALARPLIPAGSSIAWAVVLPTVLVAAVAFGVGTAVWKHRRARWLAYAAGTALAALALAAVALEHVLHLGTLIGQSRDMVVLIDGSASMTLEVDGRSQFSRAVDEARGLVDALRGAATVSIVLAGPVPVVKTPVPLTDTEQLHAILNKLHPTGGMMDVPEALRTAALILSTANNATKQIVLLTDGHKAGWNTGDRELWDMLADQTRTIRGTAPQVFCRAFPAPGALRNIAVTEWTASRRVVGTDRPLTFRARIANTGQTPVAASSASLAVDGKSVDRRPVGRLDPGESETVTFLRRFDAPGPHVVEIAAEAPDDLPRDNRRSGAVHVLDHVGVLVVNGRADGRPLERASAFVQMALDPASAAQSAPTPMKSKPDSFVQVAVVEPWQLNTVQDWRPYRAVVLAGAGELPDAEAKRLAEWVLRGGRLLILSGRNASEPFLKRWSVTAGGETQPVAPAALREWKVAPVEPNPVHPVAESLALASLASLRDARQNDLEGAILRGYWRLEVEPDRGATVAGRLSDGAPWLVEHALGRGRVLLSATAFDARDGTLPNRRAFVPLMHGLVHHLADDWAWELNPRPGRRVSVRLAGVRQPEAPAKSAPDAKIDALPPVPAPRVELTDPLGDAVEVASRWENGTLTAEVEAFASPGIYRLAVPDMPEAVLPGSPPEGVPFVVAADPAESELQWLAAEDFRKVGLALDLRRLSSGDDLQAIAAGRTHGVELWRSLMLLALLCILGEVALTWWIALQRIPNAQAPIDFTRRTGTESFREELKKLADRASKSEEQVVDLLEAGG